MDLSTTTAPNVASAIETVASHLHPTPSWDLADHPMPKGLEEIWRFTPVRQIRALLEEGDVLPGRAGIVARRQKIHVHRHP